MARKTVSIIFPRSKPLYGRLRYKSAMIRALGQFRPPPRARRWGWIAGQIAEFAYKSAIAMMGIVESGRMLARELPHYWRQEQVRQILVALPAGQPWLFALLLWRAARLRSAGLYVTGVMRTN